MKLENACLCVEIAEKGAELTRIFNKKTGAEILWNGNPEFWNRHSPILFPNVGKTHGNTVLIKGTQYPTSQHGFARDSQFRCVKSAAEEAQFLFCSNEETREVYPYDFELYITYRLDGKNIFVDWKVKNPSEETIYFTIGAHPAFMFEGAKETKDDYLLWFPKMETLECCGLNLECGTGLPEESYSLELEDGYLQLSEKLFEVDTLICDDYQLKEVWLCKKDGRKPYVGVKSEGFYSYGIWSPKNAPFVCLEPWAGRCDDTGFDKDISEKKGINAVQPGEVFEKGYQIFLYNSENERMYRPTEIFQTLTQNQLVLLNKHLIQKITAPKTSFYTDAWEVLMLGKNVYFYKSFHTGSHYACCFIPADNIIQPLKNIIKEKDGFISLTSQNGTVLTNKELLKQHHIEFSRKSNSDSYETYNKGNNLIISGALIMGAFYPQIILSKFRAYEKIILLQFILALAVLLVAVILFTSIFYMKKHVLTPIKLFLENLAHLDDSAETINLKDTNLLELEQANSQFKNLMRQIKKLKIDIYEKELEKQKTMMNYLQLQIRPHFFLNCLNTIYSMAQTQLYEEIMKMSMITSNYFRYIFQNTQDLVPVKNELEHIKNYMEIQKMRYGDTFSYEIHAEEGTENIRIPPILIQTFIENAIKHSNTFDEPIIIRTDIAWMTAGGNSHENIQIQVMDTGCGFSEDILQSLNSAIPLEPQNGHRIGITNAIQRLNLLYGQGEAVITFSNLPSGGACVTILLPAV